MNQLYCIPSLNDIKALAAITPKHMRPSINPSAVVLEGALTDEECDAIIAGFMFEEEPYKHQACGAETREGRTPLRSSLNPIRHFAKEMNDIWWKFDLDDDPIAWLQTYEAGGVYQPHTDDEPSQSRKFTTIALLSHPAQYEGGQLRIVPYPHVYDIPKTRGTMVAFPSWMLHDVLPIEFGIRQTINMGFWGPPFR